MATKKITLNELRSLVKNIIKEETSKKKVIKENWEGVDSDLETSLFEYGFVVKQRPDKDYNDEWFVLYNAGDNKFDTGHIRESELNNIILGKEWADEDDIQSFLNTVGSTKEDWLNSTFTNKLSDLLSYWGHENIMGTSYMGFSKDEAEEMLMNESVKPKTQKIKLSEVRQLVRSVIKEESEPKIESLNDYLNRVGKENLPKPKYNIGDRVLVDMGDGSKEELTISKISYFKPPKSNFSYAYRSEEYSEIEPNMIYLEDNIIKKI